MDQAAIDALLSQIQTQADGVAGQADAAPVAGSDILAVDNATATINEIAGDMEPPSSKNTPAGQVGAIDPGLAGEFSPAPSSAGATDVSRLLTIEVPLIVQLGRRRMSVGEVMRLGAGAIIEFHKSADEELDLLVNNKSIGRGAAVKVGENFGIRITAIDPVRETIRKLGAA